MAGVIAMWQMLCHWGVLFEADVITSIDMADVIACLFMADVIVIEADVITSIDKADVIAYLFWLMLLPCGWCYATRVIYFNFSSGMLFRTPSHMWGRWYLPIFLLRDGLFTLI